MRWDFLAVVCAAGEVLAIFHIDIFRDYFPGYALFIEINIDAAFL
jgi:hypothetical protein